MFPVGGPGTRSGWGTSPLSWIRGTGRNAGSQGSRGSAGTLSPGLGDGNTALLWKVHPWEPPAGTFPGASVSPIGKRAKVTGEL